MARSKEEKAARKLKKLAEAEAESLEENSLDAKKVKKEKKEKRKEETVNNASNEDTTSQDIKKQKKEKKRKERESDKKEEAATDEIESTKGDDKKSKKEKKKQKVEHVSIPTTSEAPASAAPSSVTSGDGAEYRKTHEITSVGDAELPEPFQEFSAAPFSAKLLAALSDAKLTCKLAPCRRIRSPSAAVQATAQVSYLRFGDPPTPIQAQSWPVAMRGDDLIAVAKTGSGKTLGFLLPALHTIQTGSAGSKGPYALVIAPTRELAMQIHEQAQKYGKCVGLRSCCVYGGVPKGGQLAELRTNPQLVVGTPGRLNDLLQSIGLANTRYLVLDEADRMLDMGFEPQITTIIQVIPPETRQTLLFTATWPKSVKKMAAKYLKDAVMHINIGSTEELAANTAVSQVFHKLNDGEKDEQLYKVIEAMADTDKMMVFANTKRRIDNLAKTFYHYGASTCAIHGDKTQAERDASLAQFIKGEVYVMVATDVAARGLDIHDVTHVVNYDMPRDVENYVHRIGRCGRAGKTGSSITFWNEDYDRECAPALVKIAEEAGQVVPDWLKKYANAKTNKAWKLP
ncbi:hypothetical protein CYMTET_38900 [Cymbomonas tetramitiformis]|uniref:RNA helicase n=1 Tax=Cymbomonas tetramitiformis TaxID=36881 RepID=A0AAE0F4T2_9CHLO|nr:hypothetical protein CYMTET_38900 [Cymbomonas tetramitiformis]